MTRAEIIALQESLNQQGFNLVVDGRYGQKTRDAYAEYLDRDNAVPTQVPPAPKPWYLKTLSSAFWRRSLPDCWAVLAILDAGELTNVLLQIVDDWRPGTGFCRHC
jgi:peptidoglycan hydrolase-like protein with peptidoglycan-binding domain